MKLHSFDDRWFYSNPHPLLRLLTVYVKGDMLLLIPVVLCIGLIGLWSIEYMLLMFAIIFTVRGFGEMIYWICQQFGPKTYRPYDWGFKKLGNDAIYILYQLFSLACTVAGLGVTVYILKHWL
ncbi:hypothetical protein KBC70_03165 [Candidatus Woesebacteria bacterium]|nr:hypothetical protein [Candidatus Woesebacteria bacterium]